MCQIKTGLSLLSVFHLTNWIHDIDGSIGKWRQNMMKGDSHKDPFLHLKGQKKHIKTEFISGPFDKHGPPVVWWHHRLPCRSPHLKLLHWLDRFAGLGWVEFGGQER